MLGPVHSTPEDFENGGFALKKHQMFSFPARRIDLKPHQSPAILDLCSVEENAVTEMARYRYAIIFEKPLI